MTGKTRYKVGPLLILYICYRNPTTQLINTTYRHHVFVAVLPSFEQSFHRLFQKPSFLEFLTSIAFNNLQMKKIISNKYKYRFNIKNVNCFNSSHRVYDLLSFQSIIFFLNIRSFSLQKVAELSCFSIILFEPVVYFVKPDKTSLSVVWAEQHAQYT